MEIRTLWVVADPTENTELGDILYQTTPAELASIIRGAGPRWEKDHVKFYTDERSAKAEAERRLKNRKQGSFPGWTFTVPCRP